VLRVVGALALAALASGCGWQGDFLTLTTDQKLASARADLAAREWRRASEKFRILAGVYRGTPQFPEVQYGLGRALAGMGDTPAAERELSVVVREYPDSEWADDASFAIAEVYVGQMRPSQLEQTSTYQAIDRLREFLRRFPQSPLEGDAQGLLVKARSQLAKKEVENGRLYLRLGDGPAARVHFETVLHEYADTPWRTEAQFGLARAFCEEFRLDEALAAYRAVVEIDSTGDFGRRSRERIKEIETKGGCS
jgi:outer membrane protein assembly factor BamD